MQERVLALRGGREMLEALGFRECELPASEGAEPEGFLVLAESDVNLEALLQVLTLH